jgi:uncharacterized membrane protein
MIDFLNVLLVCLVNLVVLVFAAIASGIVTSVVFFICVLAGLTGFTFWVAIKLWIIIAICMLVFGVQFKTGENISDEDEEE